MRGGTIRKSDEQKTEKRATATSGGSKTDLTTDDETSPVGNEKDAANNFPSRSASADNDDANITIKNTSNENVHIQSGNKVCYQ